MGLSKIYIASSSTTTKINFESITDILREEGNKTMYNQIKILKPKKAEDRGIN